MRGARYIGQDGCGIGCSQNKREAGQEGGRHREAGKKGGRT